MKPVDFDYSAAETVDEALTQLSGADVKVMSGGQSLGPMLNLRLVRPSALVGLAATALSRSAFSAIRGAQSNGTYLGK